MTPVRLQGVGVVAPGLTDWPGARQVLRGEAPYEPAPLPPYRPTLLPRNEARRAGACVKLAFRAAEQACDLQSAEDYASIFASAGGDLDISDRLCRAVTTADKAVSPTHFHNSVHNAAAGYWSIATRSRKAANSVSAYRDTFSVALMDAWGWLQAQPDPVLLVCFESDGGGLIAEARPSIHASFAVALALGQSGDEPSALLSPPTLTDRPATRLDDPVLEDFRTRNPAARSLPLLQAIAKGEAASVVLESSQGNLAMDVEPD